MFVGLGAVIAVLGASTARRAEASERARGRLAEEQAALRRVATLVARDVRPADVLAAAAAEVGALLHADGTMLLRYDGDDVEEVAGWTASGPEAPRLGRARLATPSIAERVLRTGAVTRSDDYELDMPSRSTYARRLGVRSAAGCPIIIEASVWGVMIAWSRRPHGLARGIEAQMADFTDLVAMGIANAHAHAEVQRLAAEQSALRRVATLVARMCAPGEVFAAVAHEVQQLFGADRALMYRHEGEGPTELVAQWPQAEGAGPPRTPPGSFFPRAPVRTCDASDAGGALAGWARALGARDAAGCPLVVDGRPWGALLVVSTSDPLPRRSQSRLGHFAELLATAVSNVQAHAELAASRARIVAAMDDTRRRFERNLHDGAQQRLVSLNLELRVVEDRVASDPDGVRTRIAEVRDGLAEVLEDLRELSRGLHPAILTEGGLRPAIRALARRASVPTRLDVDVERRFQPPVEVAAYYVVSEALTNVAKHAGASETRVRVDARNGILEVTVDDDGVGGADPRRGSGLIGLVDRVEALGGTLAIASPAGGGTSLHVELPVGD